jgi:hypothetical protein
MNTVFVLLFLVMGNYIEPIARFIDYSDCKQSAHFMNKNIKKSQKVFYKCDIIKENLSHVKNPIEMIRLPYCDKTERCILY